MLIEVTDAHGIYVPRFCYHPKLSVAANCRMCLVEVERAPKALPACATPITEGMRVWTRSKAALEAQRAVMEFLLINHPLDCPICDQGGECELQDLAMGYGRGISQYQEGKRVVVDRDIGPLVQTDMTRCIHCTRCVRFGEEIAGLRELGATGRGEQMEIGSYVARAMESELSGNVIDLCPVGALTSKPFRYSARAWEMSEHGTVAPHDGVGSGVRLHLREGRVLRVAPAHNEAVNENWLSDRDRFSYEGLHSEDRLREPLLREASGWRPVSWDKALDFAATKLPEVLKAEGGGTALGGLISPSATFEELRLFSRLVRGLGSPHLDHRLRQGAFSSSGAPPRLGCALRDLEESDAVLLIGANPRQEQPLLNHRLRQAARRGAAILALNSIRYDFNYDLAFVRVVAPSRLPTVLASLAAACTETPQGAELALDKGELAGIDAAARCLRQARRPRVLLGESALAHPRYAALEQYAAALAQACGATLGYLAPGANACGAWAAGALPGPVIAANGKDNAAAGTALDALGMLRNPRPAYLLHGLEPELDCWDGSLALRALRQARFVVMLSSYHTPAMLEYAHLLLPIALYAENEGSYMNLEGRLQCFSAGARPPGLARPAWRVLRVLGNRLRLTGFEQRKVEELRADVPELAALGEAVIGELPQRPVAEGDEPSADAATLELCVDRSMYGVDALVRRAPSLQATGHAVDAVLRLHPATAARLALGARARLVRPSSQGAWVLPTVRDPRVPEGCLYLRVGHPLLAELGEPHGQVLLEGGLSMGQVISAGAIMDALGELLRAFAGKIADWGLPAAWAPQGAFFLQTLFAIACILAPLILCIAYLTYAERKVIGAMQGRLGPNRVGPAGLLQPFADVIKLLCKEVILPSGASRLLFVIAPVLALAPSLAAWAVLPFDSGLVLADINASLLYVLALASLGVYGIILAGWASNSQYAFLGAMRSAAQIVAYELSMGFALVGVVVAAGGLNLGVLAEAQQGGFWNWFIWPLFPLFVVYFISGVAETNRAPFDVAEGESEIVAGFHVEYSGIGFSLFFLAEYANMILISVLTALLFLGGWDAPLPFLPSGIFWLLLKASCFLFVFIWLRATLPRFRYDQIMRLGWKVFIPITLGWLLFTALLVRLKLPPWFN